jgi:uncharacterized protein YjiS (DUF1127 family)
MITLPSYVHGWEPVAPAQSRNNWAGRVVARCREMGQRRRAILKLQAMSDRDLADIGLGRGDIPRVFDPEFARERNARRV